MASVVFEEEPSDSSSNRFAPASSKKGITAWLIAHKFAKDEPQASALQLSIVAAVVVITIFVWVGAFRHAPAVSPAERKRDVQWMLQGHSGRPPANFMPILTR